MSGRPSWAEDAKPPAAVTPAVAEVITQHSFVHPTTQTPSAYLLYEPRADTPAARKSLLIFLYGAGGSLKGYNLMREPYAQLRAELLDKGFYLLVPDLGKRHFMNESARSTLDGIVAEVLTQQSIPAGRVHVMGTSMGGGSSLAYAVHRPDLIRSVCAVMPMTDFATWAVESPKYAAPIAEAYGGTPDAVPDAYRATSAMQNLDAFAPMRVMLIHGKADRTVPFQNSQRLADALQQKGYPCDLRLVEDVAHKDVVVEPLQADIARFFEAANADAPSAR